MLLVWSCCDNSNEHERLQRKSTTQYSGIVCLIMSCFLIIIFCACSYFNTIHLYGNVANIKELQGLINLYAEKANSPTGAQGKLVSDLTDQKYADYQDNLNKHVLKLRYTLIGYNRTLAQKRALRKGFFFGALVSLPTDLELITIIGQ